MSTVKGFVLPQPSKFALQSLYIQSLDTLMHSLDSSLIPPLGDCQYLKKRGYINLLAIQKRSMPKTMVKLRDLVFKAKIKVGIATNSSG